MLYYEKKAKDKGFSFIIGVDEVGRGPLAGPVVAAAVKLNNTNFKNYIDDSKKLTPLQREIAFPEIYQKAMVGIGIINETTIDEVNILNATVLAMEQAVNNLIYLPRRQNATSVRAWMNGILGRGSDLRRLRRFQYGVPTESSGSVGIIKKIPWLLSRGASLKQKITKNKIIILIDGNLSLNLPFRLKSIINGDSKSLSIASASIVAKVIRDRIMAIYDKVYPDYCFIEHKGYGTKQHFKAIKRYGPCPIHRRSFRPIKQDLI